MIKVFAVLFIVGQLLAQSFVYENEYEADYKQAVEKAKEQKKDIVMVLVGSYCPWCDKLKEDVLSLEYTNEILDKHYIKYIAYSGDDYPSKFNTYVVPTIYFISYKDGSIIEKIMGYNNNYRFYEIIEAHK